MEKSHVGYITHPILQKHRTHRDQVETIRGLKRPHLVKVIMYQGQGICPNPNLNPKPNLGGVQYLLRQGTPCVSGHTAHVSRGCLPDSQHPRGGKKQLVGNNGCHHPTSLFHGQR